MSENQNEKTENSLLVSFKDKEGNTVFCARGSKPHKESEREKEAERESEQEGRADNGGKADDLPQPAPKRATTPKPAE